MVTKKMVLKSFISLSLSLSLRLGFKEIKIPKTKQIKC